METQVTRSTEHLEEGVLGLYVLNAPELGERRREIAVHLEHCAGCAELLQEIASYYAEAEELQEAKTEIIVPELEGSSPLVRRSPAVESGQLSPKRRPAMQIFASSFKTYPVRWSAACAVIAAALVLLVPKLMTTDRNPAYVRAKNEFLTVLNENGDELWRKFVGSGFDAVTQQIPASSLSAVADVDGDGKNEIFLMPPNPTSSSAISRAINSIVSYNGNGDERWRFGYTPDVVFGKESFSSDYVFESPLVLADIGKEGKHEVVFVAHHGTWWPSVVGRINAKDGSIISEYWHPGWIKILPELVVENGIRKMIGAGYNNAFHRSALMVLDSRRIEGHAPATSEYTPLGIPEATEMFYALLPKTDLDKLGSPRPSVSGIGIDSNGLIEVRSARAVPGGESGDWVGIEVYFYFDSRLNCVNVKLGDDFTSYHSRLEKEGKLTKKLDAQYFEDLRRGVEYWDGEKFVKEVTMNRKYLSIK